MIRRRARGPRAPEGGGPGADDHAAAGRVARWAAAPYGALLRLYPGDFRRRFGSAMLADFTRLCDEAWRVRGARGLAGAWLRGLRDLGRSVPQAWRGAPPVAAGLIEDVRSALRSLWRAPVFMAAATGVLALAIGGVAIGLGLVDAYLLRGLPYPAADRLVSVRPAMLPYEHADPSVVEHAVTWDLDAFTLVDGARPRLVRSAWISPAFEEVFGIEPALGRGFGPEHFGEGGARVALLSHALWQDRYGGDPDIVGRTIALYASDRPHEAEAFTVIGVLPRSFWYHNAYAEMLVPLRVPNPVYMARLRTGVTLPEAERALTAAALRAGADLPPEGLRLTRFGEDYAAGVRPALTVLAAAVVLVLLLAAANACILLLVRAAGRQAEFGVRRALGAARARLGRQLLAEGLLLAGVATGAGLLLAALATRAIAAPVQARLGVGIPGGLASVGPSASVVLATIGAGIACGLALGAAGMAGVGRTAVGVALAAGRRGGSDGRRARRLRDTLVAGELALSLTLLVGAALALGSVRHLATLDLGFATRDRLTVQVNLRAAAYPEREGRAAFFDRLADDAGRLPGVVSAGLVSRAPFNWNFNAATLEADVGARGPGAQAEAVALAIGPGLLRTLDVRLVLGRNLAGHHRVGAPRAVLVSERLAERLWPDQNALGQRLRRIEPAAVTPDEPEAWWTVVGVTADVRQQLDGDAPDLWLPYAQVASTSMVLALHLRPGTPSPVPALEELLGRLDPEVAITSVTTLEEATAAARGPSRFLAAMLGGFSLLALTLAVLGLYAVVSYAAARRSRDVALHMALGARAGQVVGLFVGESLPVIAAGLAVGMVTAALLAGLLASQLRGVSPWHAPTYGSVALVLAAAALVAAWLPARRAAAGDPASVLRDE